MPHTMTQSPDISLEIRGEREEIAVIRLTRPAKRHAFTDFYTYRHPAPADD